MAEESLQTRRYASYRDRGDAPLSLRDVGNSRSSPHPPAPEVKCKSSTPAPKWALHGWPERKAESPQTAGAALEWVATGGCGVCFGGERQFLRSARPNRTAVEAGDARFC